MRRRGPTRTPSLWLYTVFPRGQLCTRQPKSTIYNLEDLQALVDKITHHSSQYGLEVYVNKTKLIIISKQNITGSQLFVNQATIERVDHYNYLGTIINKDWSHIQEIRARIGKARATFNRMSAFFKSHNITLDTKVRLLRCYVFFVLRTQRFRDVATQELVQ